MLRLPAWISLLGMVIILVLLSGCSGSGGGNSPIAAYSITPGNQNGLTLQAGQQVQVSPTVMQNGTPIANPVLSYSVTGGIGAITPTGQLTATTSVSSSAPKTGTVHVAGYGQAIDIPVTVTVGPVANISIVTPTGVDLTHVLSGASISFTADGSDQYGNRGASRFAVTPTWSVQGGVGTISSAGVFQATTAGTGKVVATIGSVTANVQITVVTGALSQVIVTPSADASSLTVGDTLSFTAVGADAAGNRGTRIPVTATWTLQGSIGTLTADGHFTASDLGQGTVVATVQTANGPLTGTLSINVKNLFKGLIDFVRQDVNSNLEQLDGMGDITALTTGTHNFQYPNWSADGRYLLFASATGANTGICVLDTTNGSTRTVVSVQGRYPAWSPDGTKIAYCEGVAGTGDITVVNASDGSYVAKMAVGALGSPAHPSWSPDGNKLIFTVDDSFGLANGVFEVNSNGTGPVTTLYGGAAANAIWAKDMQSLYVTDKSTIVMVNLQGQLLSTLATENSGTIDTFTLSPDGKAVCYSVSDGTTEQLKMRLQSLTKTYTLTNISGASAVQPCWKQ